MDREGDTDQKRGKAPKAKLDSKGRPIVVKAPEPDKREDKASPVRVAVRLGCLLLLVSSQSGCEPEARNAELDPRIEAAVTDARAAASEAKQHAALAHTASQSALTSVEQCKALGGS